MQKHTTKVLFGLFIGEAQWNSNTVKFFRQAQKKQLHMYIYWTDMKGFTCTCTFIRKKKNKERQLYGCIYLESTEKMTLMHLPDKHRKIVVPVHFWTSKEKQYYWYIYWTSIKHLLILVHC